MLYSEVFGYPFRKIKALVISALLSAFTGHRHFGYKIKIYIAEPFFHGFGHFKRIRFIVSETVSEFENVNSVPYTSLVIKRCGNGIIIVSRAFAHTFIFSTCTFTADNTVYSGQFFFTTRTNQARGINRLSAARTSSRED